MKSSYLINPFVRIAGVKALLLGIIGLMVTSFIAYLTGTHIYGFAVISFAKNTGIQFLLIEQVVHWFIIGIALFISGKVLSKTHIRLVDIFGTSLLARVPLIIVPVLRGIPYFQSFVFLSPTMFVLVVIYIISAIWAVILLFHGFKISSNLKGKPLAISFITSLLISEISTQLIIYMVYYKI